MDYKYIDGIRCYAPELAHANEDFPSESFIELYNLEGNNFWFKARNILIKNLLKRFLDNNKVNSILEIGCGTGHVIEQLQKEFPLNKYIGGEIHIEGLKFAQTRLHDVELVQFDATQLPYNNIFESACAFDVLEHIEEDEVVLKNIYNSLKDNGILFITVPQYEWMWSINDTYACHKRRYLRKELIEKLAKADFKTKYVGSFVFALFPLMVISRLLKGKGNLDDIDRQKVFNELKLPALINSLFYFITLIDVFLIRLGLSLPWGGSLVCVAQKSSKKNA